MYDGYDDKEREREQARKHDPKRKAQKAAASRRYRAKPATDYRARRRDRWEAGERYGLTLDQFAAMEEAQDWECAICQTPLDRPCIDHSHCTGRVRGLLCKGCNTGLGMFRESRAALRRAIKYLGDN
jgi:hypothetical protein